MRYLFICLLGVVAILPCSGLGQHKYTSSELPDSVMAAGIRATLNGLAATDYLKRTFHNNDSLLNYRLLLPVPASGHKKYPLVITLHNSTRIGEDNEKQLEPMARIWLRSDIRTKYQAYVLAPQFATRSSNYAMDSAQHVMVSKPSSDVGLLLKLIKEILEQYPDIDTRRIYLVGYSMGASTAQNLMSLSPQTFAAIVSVAGVPDFSNVPVFTHKPVWLIHGQKDEDNPYSGSERLFEMLGKNRKAIFTTYTQLNHNTITIPLLLTDQIPQWLFSQIL